MQSLYVQLAVVFLDGVEMVQNLVTWMPHRLYDECTITAGALQFMQVHWEAKRLLETSNLDTPPWQQHLHAAGNL